MPTERKANETESQYLKRALKWCKAKFIELREHDRYCHVGHIVNQAMRATEKEFIDLGTFGVEYICGGYGKKSPSFDYLNTGDTYCPTIIYKYDGRKNPWCIASWGDIVERGNYD